MTLTSILKVAEILGILLGATAFALVTYWRLREKTLAREHGMSDNPERCKDHEDRLRRIEEVATRLDEKVSRIEDDVAEIKGRIR
jgi:hypothetical protein